MRQSLLAAATILSCAAGVFSAAAQPSNAVMSTPVYVPDTTHAGDPLPDGIIAWDATLKSLDATNGQDFAYFAFSFTNITAGFVTIIDAHPSCGCTTAELPSRPWTLPAGTNGQINLTVNLAGKNILPGSVFKYVDVSTDKGHKQLMMRINILPPPPMPEMTEEQRDAGIKAAKVDRQAVFKGDCATCHVKNIQGKYGQELFNAICAVCHEAQNRATLVPDLHNLKVPTNEEFWRAWITSGKAGSLMPAFATAQGGPMNDFQIASLAAYLNATIPSHVPPPAPAPAAK
jgi:mono/diheme cytochrome c family protein